MSGYVRPYRVRLPGEPLGDSPEQGDCPFDEDKPYEQRVREAEAKERKRLVEDRRLGAVIAARKAERENEGVR